MLGQPVAKWQKKDEVQKVKFKRVGFDDEGNMYYRLGQKKYVKYNKDVVEIVDSVPVEFVKVKELVKQVTPNLKELEGTLMDFATRLFKAETDEETLILVVWLLSCFFVNSKDRPLLIIEGEYSEVLAGMLRKIILPITYIEPIVINNGTSENSRTCYMLTSYVTRKMMNDKELLAKAIHIRLEDSEMASGYDVEAILNSFEKELPNLLAQIFLTVKIVYLWCLKRTKLSPKVITY